MVGNDDIICAISTPAGVGAIAVVRLSGRGCAALVDRVYTSPSDRRLQDAAANTVHFGYIKEGEELVDEVLVAVFHAPHSYTGEESVEISCHGSVYIQQRLLKLLIDTGARLANPGEFTQRAFLNGKMDLSQAEGVADLIALAHLRVELLRIVSLLELELDFSEEDVEFADRAELTRIAGDIERLLVRLCRSFSLGNALKNGVPVAIVGNTNVGKSTLLNALLKEDRAIVSDIEGTTRDVIEDTINLEGVTFRFIDTAGIRQTEDEIENMGIGRTFEKIRQARIVLLLTDFKRGVEGFEAYYLQVKQHVAPDARLIIVLNKIDEISDLLTYQETIRFHTSGETIVPISARTGENLESLVYELTRAYRLDALSSSDVIVSNVRHYEALKNALQAIRRAMEGLKNGVSGEFVSQDVRECMHYLGEITGEISTDEVLGFVFRHFCIGK